MSDFGVYVHVPFCAHRCDYCAFATYSDRDHLMTQYVDCVVREINDAVGDGMPRATSVFFGGGTPSRLEASELLRILEAIPRTDDAEVTVECNPE
ncbi:MAG: radical SAM protein, partial [Actinomycetota bacterium]